MITHKPAHHATPGEKKNRWAAAKLRAMLSANADPCDTAHHVIGERTIKAIVHAIRVLEGRTP